MKIAEIPIEEYIRVGVTTNCEVSIDVKNRSLRSPLMQMSVTPDQARRLAQHLHQSASLALKHIAKRPKKKKDPPASKNACGCGCAEG